MPCKAKRKSNLGRHSASANASREKRRRESEIVGRRGWKVIIGERMRQMRERRRGQKE